MNSYIEWIHLYLLCQHIPYIWVSRIVPTALSSPVFDVEWTPAGSYWWTGNNIKRNNTWKVYTCTHSGQEKLSSRQIQDPKWSLTHPGHKWILPQGDLQIVPYVPPPEQRLTIEQEQRVPTQPPHLPNLACITDAPPIMWALNPTMRRALNLTMCKNSRWTQNNILGSVSLITNTVQQRHIPSPPQFLQLLSHHDVPHILRHRQHTKMAHEYQSSNSFLLKEGMQ